MFIKKSTFPKMRNWLFFGDRKCSLAPKRCRFYRGQAFAESLCFMSGFLLHMHEWLYNLYASAQVLSLIPFDCPLEVKQQC